MAEEEKRNGIAGDTLYEEAENGDRTPDEFDDEDAEVLAEATLVPVPPDGGWGWVIVFCSFMANMVVDGIAYSYGVFFDHIQRSFHCSRSETALAGSLLAGCYLMAGPIVGALVNRYGSRKIMIFGSVFGATTIFASAYAHNILAFIILFGMLGGIGFGFIYLPAIVHVGYYFEKKRALATGICVAGSGVGTFVFAPLAVALLWKYDWRGAMWILSGLVFNCAVFGSLMRSLKPMLRFPDLGLDHMKPCSQDIASDNEDDGAEAPPAEASKLLSQQVLKHKLMKALSASRSRITSMSSPTGSGNRSRSNSNAATLRKPSALSTKVIRQATVSVDQEVEKAESNELIHEPQDVKVTVVTTASDTTDIPGQLSLRSKEKVTQLLQPLKDGANNNHESSLLTRDPQETAQDRRRRFSRIRSPTTSTSTGVLHHPVPTSRLTARSYAQSICSSFDQVSGAFRERGSTIDPKEFSRPLYRQDIFYVGSIVHLPEFKKSHQNVASYRTQTISIPQNPEDMEADDISLEDIDGGGSCSFIPKPMRDTLCEMMDFGLLQEPFMMLYCLSNVFSMLAFYVPFVYLRYTYMSMIANKRCPINRNPEVVFFSNRAIENGVDATEASFLLSIIGVANTLGRIIFGVVSDRGWMGALTINNFCVLICGGMTIVCAWITSLPGMVLYAITFGFFISAHISLTSIILVEHLGLDKLTNSFGVLILFRGIASMAGTPLAGAVYDQTGSYDASFIFAGLLLIASSFCSFLVPAVPYVQQCCSYMFTRPIFSKSKSRNSDETSSHLSISTSFKAGSKATV